VLLFSRVLLCIRSQSVVENLSIRCESAASSLLGTAIIQWGDRNGIRPVKVEFWFVLTGPGFDWSFAQRSCKESLGIADAGFLQAGCLS